MRRRKLLILGCGGFVGSHLVDRVLGSRDEAIEGWDVTFHKIARHAGNARLSLHQKYIDGETTISELEPAIEDVDAVISLAAICTPSQYVSSPLRTIRSNFVHAYKLVELCAKYHKWLLHTSTCEVYGRTISSYVPGEGYTIPISMSSARTRPPWSSARSPIIAGATRRRSRYSSATCSRTTWKASCRTRSSDPTTGSVRGWTSSQAAMARASRACSRAS